jgi:hypothetical protein
VALRVRVAHGRAATPQAGSGTSAAGMG